MILALALLLAAPGEPPTAAASRITEPIRIDGVLDEPAWSAAVPIGALVQREPVEGAAASEATEVRVAYDRDNLYFGIVCHDREPERIVSSQLGRDADLEVDDRILIVLDPFFDQRNGFFFEVNPAGARADGQIANNAEALAFEWDGIWEARSRRTSDGWSVELALPFKTLRFRPGQDTWGLNVERQIKRLQEKDRWAAANQNVWVSNLAQAGRLTGLEGLAQGRGLDIRPYVAAGEERSDGEAKAGLDVFKSLSPEVNASVTLNTDFAETEVDARQVNLTRFPLFFPEKRTFFLEGAGVFEAAGLGARDTDLVPFFSRQIGLVAGREVPILLGAKLTGRPAGLNIGLLDVETRRQEDLDVDPQNLLALRVSRNVLRESFVGAFLTHGNPAGTGSNTLVGADTHLGTSHFHGDQNLSLDLYFFRTDDAAAGRSDNAFGFKLDYPNDLVDVALTGKQIGDGFRAAMGFVPRTAIRKLQLYAAFQPRPGRFGIRQMFFEVEPEVITSLADRVENWSVFVAPFNLRTESGEHLEWNVIPQFERLDAPFEIQPGIVIPPGSRQWTRYRAEVNTATKRRWVADLAYWWGGFQAGRLKTLTATATLKPSPHLAVIAQTERNDATLPQGSFETRILSLGVDYRFSPDLSWSNLVQYDTESRILGAQSRLRWILVPGRDLFVVFNRGWRHLEDGTNVPSFDRGTLKFQYTIRL